MRKITPNVPGCFLPLADIPVRWRMQSCTRFDDFIESKRHMQAQNAILAKFAAKSSTASFHVRLYKSSAPQYRGALPGFPNPLTGMTVPLAKDWESRGVAYALHPTANDAPGALRHRRWGGLASCSRILEPSRDDRLSHPATDNLQANRTDMVLP